MNWHLVCNKLKSKQKLNGFFEQVAKRAQFEDRQTHGSPLIRFGRARDSPTSWQKTQLPLPVLAGIALDSELA